ncbi:MAG TPA: hypothetical protein GXX30_06980 [Firmicutes bacterium]|nr:hypothetical protein [Candidatus Fermentithermobacillaceae bacterium]
MQSTRPVKTLKTRHVASGLMLARMKDYGLSEKGWVLQERLLDRGLLRLLETETKRKDKIQSATGRFRRRLMKAQARLSKTIDKNRALTRLRVASIYHLLDIDSSKSQQSALSPSYRQKPGEIVY